ncbi:extensin family protein [Altererythrobacter arenosus]|uniref:Extensin family protein n=1 Tax=Altererythrobacter arenosus TaxID=3032592 RepID=A0ABY8FTM7_9SPHN|nr:extensin family protein [Altererythrobacter sp. CAU 1644]WFL76461.1 extensin family protein [Altererythrobacter sp. CAU 1644]
MNTRAILICALLGLTGCGMVPAGDSQPTRRSSAPVSAPAPVAVTKEAQMCLAGLGETGSRFSPLPDRYYGAGCQAVNSVQLSALQGDRGQFGLSNIGPVTCPTAQTLSGWARFGVDRAARQILGSPLARIETMGSYSCRNVAGTSRRSAHSQAAAIDVAAFVLEDGQRIEVKSDWSEGSAKEREFLRVVHQSACKRFGTVLGPDYNAAHRDHFHLEHGDGRFCR